MKTLSRESLKVVFKKVKHLHLPTEVEAVDFQSLHYYGWVSESDKSVYLVYEYKGTPTGLRLQFVRAGSAPLQLGFCEFCHKHRKRSEVLFIAVETRKRPKHVAYRSRGTWICADYQQCNKSMTSDGLIKDFYFRIVDDV